VLPIVESAESEIDQEAFRGSLHRSACILFCREGRTWLKLNIYYQSILEKNVPRMNYFTVGKAVLVVNRVRLNYDGPNTVEPNSIRRRR
jgi:hypothetical protein